MLTLLLLAALAQGGLPSPPEAIPRADPRMILYRDGDPRRTPAERRARAVHHQIMWIVKNSGLKLSGEEIALLAAVNNAAIPAAFSGDKAAHERLREAVRKMKAGVSRAVIELIGEIDLPKVPEKSDNPARVSAGS